MELHAVQFTTSVRHRRDRRVRGFADDFKTDRRLFHVVAVAHPHIGFRGNVGEDIAVRQFLHFGIAVFTGNRPFDVAAEFPTHPLHAVANAEDRDARFKNAGVKSRRAVFVNARRSARKDNALRFFRQYLVQVARIGNNFRIYAAFTHAARNQLSVLPAEINDDNSFCRYHMNLL